MKLILFLLFSFFFCATPVWGEDDCLSAGCHQSLVSLPGAHAPVAAGECNACHLAHGASAPKLLAAALPDLCLGCHSGIETPLRQAKVRHAPLYRERSCLECHLPHASPQRKLLIAPEQELCLACHGRDDFRKSKTLRNVGRELKGKKQLHGPVAEGECVACHAPHGSDYYRLLNAPYPDQVYAEFQPDSYAFCFGCHSGDLLAAGTDKTAFRNGERNLHRLHVVDLRKGRTCRTCHAPHAGGERLLFQNGGASFGAWQIPLRVELAKNGGRCFSGCHAPQNYDRQASLQPLANSSP